MKEPEPLFSVIMPTHDRQDQLTEAIRSVVAQTLPDWELIVVDDGSPDLPELPADRRIRRLRNEQSQGPAAARNRGMGVALGKFIAFLDDDDLWEPDRLRHALEAHDHADVVVCGAPLRGGPFTKAYRGDKRPSDWILDATTPPVGSTSVRREVCPQFDQSFPTAEDVDWWLRLTQVTDNVTFIEHDDWRWRRHDGVRHGIGTVRRIEGRKLLMTRHAGYFKSHPRARAFSWRRIGLLHLVLGQRGPAGGAAVRSFAARPSSGALRLMLKVAVAQAKAMMVLTTAMGRRR
jgi:glycosyltransferase involved in cell wall biosynthesis